MSRRQSLDAVVVAATKCVVSLVVLGTGFRALSDDDFARIVIAERFASSPSLDPSGTSWLPFPFWLNGAVMALFGASVQTARVAAFVLGVASIVLVWVAGRFLQLSRRAALAGAIVAGTLPYAAWLGVATVPEAYTAALTLLGAASLSTRDARRLLGALALAVACLSRYEPWPVAAVFALVSAWDAVRAKTTLLGVAAGCAVVAPLGWMLHGVVAHHDALFFVARVSEYRRAVGAGNVSLFHALVDYPWRLLRSEPEIGAVALTGACALALSRKYPVFRRYSRLALALAALLAFLVVGDIRDGAPTHHGERVLLSIWFGLALFACDALFSAAPELEIRRRSALAALGAALVALAGFLIRPWYAARDSFIDRSAETALGDAARRTATGNERLLVDTPDYGYFAVIAGFGAPSRAEPFEDHDPRNPRPPNAFESTDALDSRLTAARASLVIVQSEHRAIARELGETLAERDNLTLLRVKTAR